jgi:hypothetical protein
MDCCFVCGDFEGKLVPVYRGCAHPKCLKEYKKGTFIPLDMKKRVAEGAIEWNERKSRALDDLLESCSAGTNYIIDSTVKAEAFQSPTLKVYYALKQFDAPIAPDMLFQIVESEMDMATMNKSLRHLEKLRYARQTEGFWYNIK